MVRAGILFRSQHENKWCCAAETPEEAYRFNIHSSFYSTSPQFSWYGKNPSSVTLEPLGMSYNPLPLILKGYMIGHNKDNSWVIPTSEVQLNCDTRKPRNLNIVHLKTLMNIKINLKICSPGSKLMTGTNIYTFPTLTSDLSYHPFIKY